MSVWKHIPWKSSLVFIVILLLMNGLYYYHAKQILMNNEKEKTMLLLNSIIANVEKAAAGEAYVEQLIGEKLRTAAMAVKTRLDPDIANVTNEQLAELKRWAGVDEITLFVPQGDDIVGARSSDPKDLNISSKGWDTIFIVFQQLLRLEQVQVGMGQSLPNFWSGPIDTASSNPLDVNKWGYYYDGTTNYIINPYVHATSFQQFQTSAGMTDAIRRVTQDHPHVVLEVSVLRSGKLLGRKRHEANPTPSHWYSEREALYGQYRYRDAQEQYYAEMAINDSRTVMYSAESEGRHVMKSFSPLVMDSLKYNRQDSPLLIEIAADYGEMERLIQPSLWRSMLFMAACSAFVVAILIFVLRLLRKNKESALQDAQDVYVGNIETLFQSIREQRHDFINHIQTIHAFLSMKRYDDLHQYTQSLVGEIRVVGELVNIKDPALIALMHAKISQADSLHVQLEHDFKRMDQLKLSPIKATDVVKMLCNLIDNAFDATGELAPEARSVRVSGNITGRHLQFRVSNTGPVIPPELQHKIFERGYSSKDAGTNSGLGLHIVKQLVVRYKGTIRMKSEDGITEFSIDIPLS